MQTVQLYEFGPFQLDPARRVLLRDGENVPLTPKAFDTLLVLLEKRGQVMEKDELMKALWPDSFVEEANLTVNISTLRRALGEQPHEHHYIVTVPGRGYRFVANVKESPDESADLVVERTRAQIIVEEEEEERAGEPVTLTASPPEPLRLAGPKRPSRAVVLVVACALLALAVGALVLYRRRAGAEARPPAPIRSIAVLPLKNLSEDPASEYLSDGLTESLISALSRIEGLKVISRGSVFRFKGKEIDPREAGKQLGVAAVLEGNLRKGGDTVRVAVRLVSAEDGLVLWASDTQNRALGDIFALQDEIAHSVAGGLRIKLSGEGEQRLAGRYTENIEAYQLYLKGRFFWNKRTPEGLKKAIEYFEQAIQIDRSYALAYAGLADSYALLNFYSDLQQEGVFPRARATAEKALELDNTLAEAHTTLAYVRYSYDWDWAGAEREFKRAIELNPNYATAHQWYAEYLMYMARFDESLAEFQRAQEHDPLSLVINTELGSPYLYMRQCDRAMETYRKALEMDPNFPLALFCMGLCHEQKGMYEEAIAEYQKANTLSGNNWVIAELGRAYAEAGRKREAQEALKGLIKASKQQQSPYGIARIYASLGDKERAFYWLEKAYEDRDERMVILKVDWRLDGLRADPRFGELLGRMNLTP